MIIPVPDRAPPPPRLPPPAPPRRSPPVEAAPVAAAVAERSPTVDEAEPPPLPPTRWQYEPPEAEAESRCRSRRGSPNPLVAPDRLAPPPPPPPVLAEEHDDEEVLAGHEPAANHNVEPPMTGSSFDAALEALQRRMTRAKLTTDFVRSLLIVDNVIDVGEAAMKWAGMPNKHERSLTSEVFFALAEWGFLAPRADGRYRVLHAADDDPTV